MAVPKYCWAIIDEYSPAVSLRVLFSGPTPGICWGALPVPLKKVAASRLISPGRGSLPLLRPAKVRNDW